MSKWNITKISYMSYAKRTIRKHLKCIKKRIMIRIYLYIPKQENFSWPSSLSLLLYSIDKYLDFGTHYGKCN